MNTEERKIKKEITERLAGRLYTGEQLRQQKNSFLDLLNSNYLTEEQINHYKNQISKLDELIEDSSKISQTQGIDTMMIDMIQFRAMIYAFESLDKRLAFTKTNFFSSWHVGMTYAVFCLFFKLVDSGKGKESLKRLWQDTFKKGCNEENASINEWFNNLNKRNSQPLAFRHLIICHNSEFGQYEPVYDWTNFDWELFDSELKQLVNARNILSKFSGSAIICPFISGEKMFDGVSTIFKLPDMKVLVKKYNEFITELGFNFLEITIKMKV